MEYVFFFLVFVCSTSLLLTAFLEGFLGITWFESGKIGIHIVARSYRLLHTREVASE